MSLALDHVVIAVHDLDAAIDDYRDLGFTVRRGGVHANRATCNALITFADETYLELLAATGDPPLPGLVDFGVLLRHGEGLAGFALRADDLAAEAARLRASVFGVGDIIPGERQREDGTLVRWQLALLDGGFAPFLIEDLTPRVRRIPTDPALTTHANGVRGMAGLAIVSGDVQAAHDRFARLFASTATSSATGCVVLRDPPEGTTSATGSLYAVRLVLDAPAGTPFPLDRTHRVRFDPIPA